MGFKDFFSKGPSGRNDGVYYQNQALPNSAYLAANSATNRRYMDNMSSSGLHSTRSLRAQQPLTNQRTMSLSNRSFRQTEQIQQPRTMSMTMRSNSLTSQRTPQPSRSMSMTSSIRPPRNGMVNSRTNSLATNSRQFVKQGQMISNSRLGSRASSRNGSRANSLTSNTAHTKIVKTTTETDQAGRTKSITTTTIEHRGDIKIVRKTIIKPAMNEPIDEDAELEELAELEGFDHDDRSDNDDDYYRQFQGYGDDDGNNYSNNIDHEIEYAEAEYYDPYRNGAASAAAAAALNKNQKQTSRLAEASRGISHRAPVHPKNVKLKTDAEKNYQSHIPNTEQKKQEVRFRDVESHSIITHDEDSDFEVHDEQPGYQTNSGYDYIATLPDYSGNSKIGGTNSRGGNVGKNKPLSGKSGRKIQNQQNIIGSPASSALSNAYRDTSGPENMKSFTNSINPANDVVKNKTSSDSLNTTLAPHFEPSNSNIQIDNIENTDLQNDVEVMVVTPDMSPSESFKTRAQKRLSEIVEVTESYDTYCDEGDEEFMEEPIFNEPASDDHVVRNDNTRVPAVEYIEPPRFTAPTLSKNRNPSTTSSLTSEENFVEAQEEIVSSISPAVVGTNNSVDVSLKNHKNLQASPIQEGNVGHSYRNLLFNDSKRSPIKNSIPKFDTSHSDYSHNIDGVFVATETPMTASQIPKQNVPHGEYGQNGTIEQDICSFVSGEKTGPKKLKLKSALKNSSSSIASPVSETNTQFSNIVSSASLTKNSLRGNEKRKTEITPEEMYALALKAAEKKVYGDRLNVVYPDNDIDDDTKLNTLANLQNASDVKQDSPVTNSLGIFTKQVPQNSSQPGSPYQSNAAGLGFRLHSLRDSSSTPKAPHRTDNQESSKLKTFFKQEQRKQRKQWENERKIAGDSPLINVATQNVDKRVSRMPVDPNVELQILQQNEKVKKQKLDEQALIEKQQEQQNTTAQEFISAEAIKPQVASPTQQLPPISETKNVDSFAMASKEKDDGMGIVDEKSVTNIAESPTKSKLRMFRLVKKKNTSQEKYNHKKQDSVVSQETQSTTVSNTGAKSMSSPSVNKKSKLFSFGNGAGDSQEMKLNQNRLSSGVVPTKVQVSGSNPNTLLDSPTVAEPRNSIDHKFIPSTAPSFDYVNKEYESENALLQSSTHNNNITGGATFLKINSSVENRHNNDTDTIDNIDDAEPHVNNNDKTKNFNSDTMTQSDKKTSNTNKKPAKASRKFMKFFNL